MNHKTIIPTSISILLFTVCLQAQNQENIVHTQFNIPAGYHELLESPANGKPMQRAIYDFERDGHDDYPYSLRTM